MTVINPWVQSTLVWERSLVHLFSFRSESFPCEYMPSIAVFSDIYRSFSPFSPKCRRVNRMVTGHTVTETEPGESSGMSKLIDTDLVHDCTDFQTLKLINTQLPVITIRLFRRI
ncbi:hypothetical protein KC19_5G010300 [Ceratodon purpureus]|uniref:Uncharacterized protein n=1 Tax=Ceratodon purpureus TaxID=3225 RepID=A0A8T0HXC7_CERPU|nr:hypothetical protein KC19_5G010300 [Ceratodon purpureus]